VPEKKTDFSLGSAARGRGLPESKVLLDVLFLTICTDVCPQKG
jgi:hypothetical protein